MSLRSPARSPQSDGRQGSPPATVLQARVTRFDERNKEADWTSKAYKSVRQYDAPVLQR